MTALGIVRCSHREVAGSPNQWVVTFRASDKEFGCSLILRVPDDAEHYKVGQQYRLALEPILEQRKETRR